MAYAELIETAKDLSDNDIAEVVNFLKQKKRSDDNKVIFDLYKGDLKYMVEDFDEMPDCFKEYM